MKFNGTKLKKKIKIHDLLNDDNYFSFLFSVIFIAMLFLLIFGCILYQIIPTEIKKIITLVFKRIASYLPLLIIIFILIFAIVFLYYLLAYDVKGLLRSRYLPTTYDEMKKLNINNLKDYLEFIDNIMKEKVILKYDFYYYKLYLHDKNIEFIKELAKKEYNKEIILTQTYEINKKPLNRFCLFEREENIYLAFKESNTSYQRGKYDIESFFSMNNVEEIIYME
jgi:hypothetical protein